MTQGSTTLIHLAHSLAEGVEVSHEQQVCLWHIPVTVQSKSGHTHHMNVLGVTIEIFGITSWEKILFEL